MKRKSLIPKRRVAYAPGESAPGIHTCIRCGDDVTPGFCATGSVVAGLNHTTITSSETLNYTPGVYNPSWDTSQPVETVEVTKRVMFLKRVKGNLCSDCAASYKLIKAPNGDMVAEVLVNPGPVFYRDSSGEDRLRPKLKTLNTRYTR